MLYSNGPYCQPREQLGCSLEFDQSGMTKERHGFSIPSPNQVRFPPTPHIPKIKTFGHSVRFDRNYSVMIWGFCVAWVLNQAIAALTRISRKARCP
jgi:hypothetical protein